VIRAGALLLALLGAWLPACLAAPPARRVAALRHGVNITNWLRFPASADPRAIGSYLGDAAIADLRRAGFTFVRLPFEPGFAASASGRALLVSQVRRLQSAGHAPATGLVDDADRRQFLRNVQANKSGHRAAFHAADHRAERPDRGTMEASGPRPRLPNVHT
jgi:hypothetical protein